MDLENEDQNLIGILTTDAELIVRVWDAALERMTGISAARARGKSLAEVIPNLTERGLLSRFERVLMEGTVEVLAPAFHRFLISSQTPFESKHFTEMRQRVTIAPLVEDDQIRGLIVTVEDVTLRMEAEAELAAQLADSDEAVRLQAARTFSVETDDLGAENSEPVIRALRDKSWRVRRRLVEGLTRRAAPDAIAALLQAMRERHFDFGVLNSALQVLQSTSVATTDTLIDFLKGEDPDLRMQAALALGEQKDPQAVSALLAALEDDDRNVRFHAAEALGKFEAAEAVAPLMKIAASGDFFLSFAAMDSLRQIGDASIVDDLLKLLHDEFLREATIETLGTLGDEKTVQPLVDLLNDETAPVRVIAAALAAIYERNTADSAKCQRIIELARGSIRPNGLANLIRAFENVSASGLVPLVRFAGWFDDQQLRVKLVELLEEAEVSDAAARALIQQGQPAVSLLLEKYGSMGDEARRAAVFTLGELKNEKAVPALIELLEQDEVAREAAEALGSIGDNRAVAALFRALKKTDSAARQAAAGALTRLAHPRMGEFLTEILSDPAPGVREAAIRLLGHIKAHGFEDQVLEACRDPDDKVRKAAVEQLPNIDDGRSVKSLRHILESDTAPLRAAAAQALSRIDGQESVIALRAALEDSDAWVRYFAVRGLGHFGDAESIETIRRISENDQAEQTRRAAHEVLGEL